MGKGRGKVQLDVKIKRSVGHSSRSHIEQNAIELKWLLYTNRKGAGG